MEEDSRLVERFNGGDERAFDELVVRYYQRVCNILFHTIGPSSNTEDLAQEVFLKVYAGLPKYRSDSTFTTWLYRIAVNVGRDELRRVKRKRIFSFTTVEKLDSTDHRPIDAPSSGRPDREVERNELRGALDRAIEKIPEKQRLAFILREIEGFAYTEISEILNCSIGTVKSRLYHARLKLRKELRPHL